MTRVLVALALLCASFAAAAPAKIRCEIDGIELPAVVYYSFRASLKLDEQSRTSGETPDGGFSTVHATGAGGRYVIDERATKQGTKNAIRREPDTTKAEKIARRIDGSLVAAPVYDAFRKSLTEVPHTWYCKETNKGGTTGMSGTAKDGTRWRITERSEGDDSTFEIEREPPL